MSLRLPRRVDLELPDTLRGLSLSGSSRSRRAAGAVPWLLAGAAVAAQIAYPLVDRFAGAEPLRLLTIATVLLFFAASTSHALVHRGARWAAVLVAVTAGGGLIAEALGVRTGFPFGEYAYARTLGPQVLGVPVVIPLAWTMLAYPAFLAARRLTRRFVPLVGGVALASWDLFLDPQMVAAGHWSWRDPTPALPGAPGVPLSNYLGWLVVATAMMAALDRLLAREAADDRQPALLYLWTYASSVMGAAVFFGRPSVALVGGLVMGLVALPYAYVLLRR